MNEHETAPANRAAAGAGGDLEQQEKTTGAEQTEKPAPDYTEILLLCHPRNVANLVRSFEDEIAHAAGDLPLSVLWSGVSGLLHQGVILLEWEGKVSPAFLSNLSIDQEIFDFVVFEWTNDSEAHQQMEGV